MTHKHMMGNALPVAGAQRQVVFFLTVTLDPDNLLILISAQVIADTEVEQLCRK